MPETMTAIFEGPFNTLPATRPGTTIVVVGRKGPLTYEQFCRLSRPARFLGGYRTYYVVDTKKRIINESYSKVASKQQTLSFDVAVTWSVEIGDAARVIEKGITDLTSDLGALTRDKVVTNASMFEVEQASQAAEKIRDELRAMAGDPDEGFESAIKVIKVMVEAKADTEALTVLKAVESERRSIGAAKADAEVERIKREAQKAAIATRDDTIAQYLVSKDNRYLDVLKQRIEHSELQWKRFQETIKQMLESKTLEPHDLHEKMKAVVDAFLPDQLAPKVDSPRTAVEVDVTPVSPRPPEGLEARSGVS